MGRKFRDEYIEGDIVNTANTKMLRKRKDKTKSYGIIEKLKWTSKVIPYTYADDFK